MADKDKELEKAAAKPKAKESAPKRSVDVRKKAADKPKAAAAPVVPVTAKPKASTTAEPTPSQVVTNPTSDKTASRKSLLIKLGIGVAAVVVLVVAIFGVLIYGFSSTSPLTVAVAKVVPYPAERVNGVFVSYNDYLFEVNANEKAYVSNATLNKQTPVAWTSAEGKKLLKEIKQHALTKLEDDAITAQLASKYKVTVSDKDVNDLINTLYQKYGGKDTLLKTLSQIYGWNLNDLKWVIHKQLLSQKVQAKVAADPAIDAQTKAKAQDVLAKLKGGADFTATAKQYSQASDASNGGDLGVVAKGQVEDAVYNAAAALQPGSLSDVIKTQYGYQIIKVTEKTDTGIHLQHILVQNINYTDYFAQQRKSAKVHVYIKTT